MPNFYSTPMGCAVAGLAGMTMPGGGVSQFFAQVLQQWGTYSPLVTFAQNTTGLRDAGQPISRIVHGPQPPRKDGGTLFAEFIAQHRLGTVTSLEAPDNGVHLGSGPVRCWVWLVDYEAVAKYAWEHKHPIADVRTLEQYVAFANAQTFKQKTAEELGFKKVLDKPENPSTT
jgi:hypothetical protein